MFIDNLASIFIISLAFLLLTFSTNQLCLFLRVFIRNISKHRSEF